MQSFDYPALKRGFNRSADSYQTAARLSNLTGEQLLERLQYIKCEPKRILDLGAGVGTFSARLAKRYPKAEIVACDLAEARMQIAKRHKPWFSKIRFCTATMQQLPFTRASFDMIFSNQCLYWTPDLKKATLEMARVLKPDGVLLFSSLGPDTLQEVRTRFAAFNTAPHINIFLDMHDVGDAILAAGFRDPVMDIERLRLAYPDLRALINELRATGERNYHPQRIRHLGRQNTWAGLQADGDIQEISYEIIYGHASGSQLRQQRDASSGEVRISLDALLRKPL